MKDDDHMNTILSVYYDQLRKAVPGKPLLTVLDSRLNAVSYDMPALDEKASRAAACLKACGCAKGDRVLISERDAVLVSTFFWGALKLGAVPCVLFPELGTGGLEVRLEAAEACFFVTDINPDKLPDRSRFPNSLRRIIITGPEPSGCLHERSDNGSFIDWQEDAWPPLRETVVMDPEDDAFIVFTSGTTGMPKPVMHRQGIADAVVRSMTGVLHASPDDIFWCTAHPAWITGTVYGILGPMLCGIPSIQYEGKFHAKRWMPILQDRKVSLWYTAPTALRALMREDDDFFKNYDFSSVKQIYSIGEPLAAREFEWGKKTFSQPIFDTWFQTECGTIRIANQPGQEIIPGRMGRPVDDTEAFIAEPDGSGIGKLCLSAGFSSMFKSYYNMPEATAQKTADGFYQTGDLASVSADGIFRFEGRADDVINTSGHLVGPMEVEQVLTADPAVAEAAVVAEPDEMLYEAPAAFIVPADGVEWSRQLETALKVAVNSGVSVYAVPKHFYLLDALPQTGSGKINRAELRKRLARSHE